jgi:hypothetical protein
MNVCPKCGGADLDVVSVITDEVQLICADPNCLTVWSFPLPEPVAPRVRDLGQRLFAHERGVTRSRTLEDLNAGEAIRFRAACRLAAEQTRAEIRELIAA